MMEIVLDKEANEYGVFRKENAAEHFVKTNNRFVEAQSEMTPDHIFYSPDAKKMTLKDAPEEMKEITLPVINFFDKNKKEYNLSGGQKIKLKKAKKYKKPITRGSKRKK